MLDETRSLDIVTAIMNRLGELTSREAASLYFDSFDDIDIHHIHGDNYRVNFWSTYDWQPKHIDHSFFIRWTEDEGIIYINPEVDVEFDIRGHKKNSQAATA